MVNSAKVLVLTTAASLPAPVIDLCLKGLRNVGSSIIGTMFLGDRAHEIAFSGDMSAGLTHVRELLQGQEIDANALPMAGRKKDLLIADMDATIITGECIDELAAFHDVSRQINTITEKAMQGDIDFETSMYTRVSMLKGLSTSAIDKIYNTRIKLTQGAGTLVRTMNKAGAVTILATGGFTCFAERVAQRVGFQHFKANQLEIKNAKLTGKVLPPMLGVVSKENILKEFTLQHDLSPMSTMAVGDGANDIAMIKAAAIGVAFNAKPVLQRETAFHINHSDLTALLYLQGYKEEDFVPVS